MAVGDQKVGRDRAAVRQNIEVVRPDPEKAGVLETDAVAGRDRRTGHPAVRGEARTGRMGHVQAGIIEQGDPAIGMREIRGSGGHACEGGAKTLAQPWIFRRRIDSTRSAKT